MGITSHSRALSRSSTARCLSGSGSWIHSSRSRAASSSQVQPAKLRAPQVVSATELLSGEKMPLPDTLVMNRFQPPRSGSALLLRRVMKVPQSLSATSMLRPIPFRFSAAKSPAMPTNRVSCELMSTTFSPL